MSKTCFNCQFLETDAYIEEQEMYSDFTSMKIRYKCRTGMSKHHFNSALLCSVMYKEADCREYKEQN